MKEFKEWDLYISFDYVTKGRGTIQEMYPGRTHMQSCNSPPQAPCTTCNTEAQNFISNYAATDVISSTISIT